MMGKVVNWIVLILVVWCIILSVMVFSKCNQTQYHVIPVSQKQLDSLAAKKDSLDKHTDSLNRTITNLSAKIKEQLEKDSSKEIVKAVTKKYHEKKTIIQDGGLDSAIAYIRNRLRTDTIPERR